MNCQSEEYRRWLVIVVILLVTDVVIAPCAIALFLYRRHAQIAASNQRTSAVAMTTTNTFPTSFSPNTTTTTAATATATQAPTLGTDLVRPNDAKFLFRFGILFENFAPHAFFWNLVILARRAVCVAMDTFVISQLQWRNFAFAAVHIISLQFHSHYQPFALVSDNRLEFVSLALLSALSMLLVANPPPYTVGVQVLVTILLSIPASLFIVWFVIDRVRQLTGAAVKSTDAQLEAGVKNRIKADSVAARKGQVELEMLRDKTSSGIGSGNGGGGGGGGVSASFGNVIIDDGNRVNNDTNTPGGMTSSKDMPKRSIADDAYTTNPLQQSLD